MVDSTNLNASDPNPVQSRSHPPGISSSLSSSADLPDGKDNMPSLKFRTPFTQHHDADSIEMLKHPLSMPKFSTPDHPSLRYIEKLRNESDSDSSDSDQPPPPYDRRDPHRIPSFSADSLSHPKEPILYLPPLISSLPPTIPGVPVPQRNPPMITETRLPDIDPVSLSLHKALHYFRPYNDKYAALPYATAFNWSELKLPIDEEREWYCVAFRSKRKAGSDGTPLYEADKRAHEEAVQNGGLLMYWYGVPDPVTGLNLATCIWQSRQHAIAANSRPHHIRAMRLAKDSYEVYALERHTLRKSAGHYNVTVEPYSGAGEVVAPIVSTILVEDD